MTSRPSSFVCIDRKLINMPPVVPTKPSGGSRFAYIEIRRA
jgi:hypothetical protein